MSDEKSGCCMNQASTEFKLWRRVDRLSLGMWTSSQEINHAKLGLKKELREMLPIIVYKESFCVKDTQCSVCCSDYQADDRLQQIPACGHSFHKECIDHWLARHTTCPLCRLSLHMPPKSLKELPVDELDVRDRPSNSEGNFRNQAQVEAQNVRQTANVRIVLVM